MNTALKQALKAAGYLAYRRPKPETQNKQTIADKNWQPEINNRERVVGGKNGLETGFSTGSLIRWNHPKLGLVLPNKFIPLAEESDLITEITKYVVFKVMKTITELKMINNYQCKIAINFSLKDLESDSLFYTFKNYLQQFKIDGSSISLEITERKVILSNDKNQKHLERYKKLNVAFSMDDFGTGYSNLGYLINKPFDILKIDRSFISRIGEVDKSEEVVKATISIAKALGLRTVAEGVETKEQFDFVAKYNCDFVQGFYFKTPEPIDEIIDYLQLDDNRVIED